MVEVLEVLHSLALKIELISQTLHNALQFRIVLDLALELPLERIDARLPSLQLPSQGLQLLAKRQVAFFTLTQTSAHLVSWLLAENPAFLL